MKSLEKVLEAVVTAMVDEGVEDVAIIDFVMNSRGIPPAVRNAVTKTLRSEGW